MSKTLVWRIQIYDRDKNDWSLIQRNKILPYLLS